MKLSISLDPSSIQHAISQLQVVKDNIQNGLRQTIELLVQDGATVAQSAYGSMAVASGDMQSDTHGTIKAEGRSVIIAEFGAGDATLPVRFEGDPGVDVFPGSYSEQVGTGEYAATGEWHWQGQGPFHEVPAKAGLYQAKTYIEGEYANVAMGAIKL